MNTQENAITKTSWQDIEKAIKDIVKEGLYYKKLNSVYYKLAKDLEKDTDNFLKK